MPEGALELCQRTDRSLQLMEEHCSLMEAVEGATVDQRRCTGTYILRISTPTLSVSPSLGHSSYIDEYPGQKLMPIEKVLAPTMTVSACDDALQCMVVTTWCAVDKGGRSRAPHTSTVMQ